MSIYLDYNALAPIDLRVLEYMNVVYKNSYGNSDSRTLFYGDNVRQIVEMAGEKVASRNTKFFASGATEGNNIVIQVIYASFKYGESDVVREDRRFSNFTEISVKELLERAGFTILECFITSDVREGRSGEAWVNVIGKKIK